MTDARRRIRDITHGGKRWIVTLLGRQHADAVWRGRIAFFPDNGDRAPEVEDGLTFEALDFLELVAQAAAVSPDEIRGRLDRALKVRAS
jgi:hypothetical protein